MINLMGELLNGIQEVRGSTPLGSIGSDCWARGATVMKVCAAAIEHGRRPPVYPGAKRAWRRRSRRHAEYRDDGWWSARLDCAGLNALRDAAEAGRLDAVSYLVVVDLEVRGSLGSAVAKHPTSTMGLICSPSPSDRVRGLTFVVARR